MRRAKCVTRRVLFAFAAGCILLTCFLMTGCSGQSGAAQNLSSGTSTASTDSVAGTDSVASADSVASSTDSVEVSESEDGTEVSEDADGAVPQESKDSVDVDLTELSSTMVFAEAMNMTQDPGSYIGKTVKIRGTYSPEYFAQTDGYYHYVVVADAAACCANGFEFVWSGDHEYPNDYPDINSEIEIVGVFGQYEELGYTYTYLDVGEDDFAVL